MRGHAREAPGGGRGQDEGRADPPQRLYHHRRLYHRQWDLRVAHRSAPVHRKCQPLAAGLGGQWSVLHDRLVTPIFPLIVISLRWQEPIVTPSSAV